MEPGAPAGEADSPKAGDLAPGAGRERSPPKRPSEGASPPLGTSPGEPAGSEREPDKGRLLEESEPSRWGRRAGEASPAVARFPKVNPGEAAGAAGTGPLGSGEGKAPSARPDSLRIRPSMGDGPGCAVPEALGRSETEGETGPGLSAKSAKEGAVGPPPTVAPPGESGTEGRGTGRPSAIGRGPSASPPATGTGRGGFPPSGCAGSTWGEGIRSSPGSPATGTGGVGLPAGLGSPPAGLVKSAEAAGEGSAPGLGTLPRSATPRGETPGR